ncbi:MAG: LLM class flavin-dependent oxidoreductase [Mesorhizobium sp.]|uniref:LLM class flavin-dependent oxidoreductase n=1 Tax=Mesorhizobium sp. TaxID=1871066 RepID=UPI000FE86C5F|nr:LLM class flavin-dependent oxidoreductase [Mesorhizobium sp.]RWB32194.1 MAG: LLM class flavin-dependent oxidoreductase [Mesorhizobium sp.]RWB81792.1 MAG: LLM class flavin-dependent oxidoreductase [Mesorhizobium sp.]RWF77935.1 MAG: LLM class flavin-dependent oxidoreductase [Mesorhizobium sp.]TIS68506.1 MAG: LLM class flavin-dependent oxidoreductase [Mesorhizobium sp.]TIW51062.1 MAG: LLM class flavin-dependent oxidoreductase [Mesorhizobium sp.]
MAKRAEKLKLGAFLMPAGHHLASWRDPEAQADAGMNIGHYVDVARIAERGLFDMLFLGDRIGFVAEEREILKRTNRNIAHFEPITLLSALSQVTQNIGLAATQTTSFMEPYNLARKFSSLDHISKGRSAWNIVTSHTQDECLQFGMDQHFEHSVRYERAKEFIEVVCGLWDSWEDDAFPMDKEEGTYFRPEKLHVIGHRGQYFSVKGPLNVARPPQGWPVLIQAGTSGPGKELSARFADVVFTAEQDIKPAKEFYSDLKSLTAKYGRAPSDIKIMPGVMPIVGRSRAEAEDNFGKLQDLIHPDVGVNLLSLMMETDMSVFPLDEPFPNIDVTGKWSRAKMIQDLARERGYTIREAYKNVAAARGHRTIVGTPADIADGLEEWFDAEAADGFNIMPPVLPGGLDVFVQTVIPELQRRGLFRTAYEGSTLRDNLGVARPRFGAKNGSHKN